ncbi:MAG TPA: AAA family ATPase [Myxococcota bacterium]|jgi:hypothetical protein|nr:AAA family ATPase [Myxococcota bacterium]
MSERADRPFDASDELVALLRAGWRLVAVESFEEDRALRAVERAAETLQRPIVTWSCASGLSQGEGAGASTLELDAALRAFARREDPALLLLLDAARQLETDAVARRLRELLPQLGKRRQAVLVVAPRCQFPESLERDAGVVSLPLLRADELAALFRRVLEATPGATTPPPELLAASARAALGLTSGEAQRVFRKALLLAGGFDESCVQRIVQEKRLALRRAPALAFVDADEGLEAVGGLGELKRWLGDRRRAFGDAARRFGLPAPRGLLILGVQGCGKSLCAKAVAREWQFPLLRFDAATAFGAVERGAEAMVREAIAVAEALAPTVLWVDEIEKGFAAADADPRTRRVLGALLTWLQEKRAPVFVVATANDVSALPPELLRRGRFDELFFVDLPAAAERVEILAIHLRKRGRDPRHFPLDDLAAASERLSGAELEQAVNAALWTAFSESRELSVTDVEQALAETVPLYDTYEERIKELRDWARHRARAATVDARMVDLFARV